MNCFVFITICLMSEVICSHLYISIHINPVACSYSCSHSCLQSIMVCIKHQEKR